jgi:hypothetical protein
MLGATLRDRARRIRHVAISNTLEVSIDTVPSAYFPSALYPPKAVGDDFEGSPRENAPRSRLVFATGGPEIAAADQIAIYGGGTWELVKSTRALRKGEHTIGYEAEVLAPDVLYPLQATLAEQDWAAVTGEDPIPVAVYVPDQEATDRGSFETYEAQAPIEFDPVLQVRNRGLVLGGKRFRIGKAVANFEVPHVTMQLKRADG